MDGVPANLIGWYVDIHAPSVNCKLHLVTGFLGGLADHLIVKAIVKCQSDDLNPQLIFHSLLAVINFIMQPGGIILPPRCVPQIVMRHRVSLNVNSSISHMSHLAPDHPLTARSKPY